MGPHLKEDHLKLARELAAVLAALPEAERIGALNDVRAELHTVSPMRDEPVDFVEWVPADQVIGNVYNPNVVAPPEMKLLVHSVRANGYTMPIVTHHAGDHRLVVDGFHRSRVGKEVPEIKARCHGYLPVTRIRADRADEAARIASTIEHNRARGEHVVGDMSEIVRMLYQAGWRDDKIEQELGMDGDEVRRLKQMTGLAALFSDHAYSTAWEPAGEPGDNS